MANSIPTGIQINNTNLVPVTLVNVTNLAIKNNSNGTVYYTFGGTKFELLEGEEDIFPSPNDPMNGRIDFTVPSGTTTVNIKIKTVQKL